MRAKTAGTLALALVAVLLAPAPVAPAADGGPGSAADMVGKQLRGADGRSLGEVEKVLVDRGSRAALLVVGVGGFLGLGARQVVVPLSAVRVDGNGWLTSGLTPRDLDALRPYEPDG